MWDEVVVFGVDGKIVLAWVVINVGVVGVIIVIVLVFDIIGRLFRG